VTGGSVVCLRRLVLLPRASILDGSAPARFQPIVVVGGAVSTAMEPVPPTTEADSRLGVIVAAVAAIAVAAVTALPAGHVALPPAAAKACPGGGFHVVSIFVAVGAVPVRAAFYAARHEAHALVQPV